MDDHLLSLYAQYEEVLNKQKFNTDDLDYDVFKNHIPFLEKLDTVESGGILVFDLCKREHIFISNSMEKLMGYNINEMHEKGNDYFDLRIHPDDIKIILGAGIQYLNLYFSFPIEERINVKFKAINEYRIQNGKGEFIRVVEQFMPLEYDRNYNIWLVVSVFDIIPNANIDHIASSRLHLPEKGELIQYNYIGNKNPLSKREKQVLKYISKGMPSKQIADELFISVNTVNTHRQKIIEKLNVKNTFEAIQFAHKIGLFL